MLGAQQKDGGHRVVMPEYIEVIITIRKTAKVIPISRAENFPLSFTNSL